MKDTSGRFSPGNRAGDDLIFACSPHSGGSTDRAALMVAAAWERCGFSPGIVYLREYRVRFCLGCGQCAETGECVFQAEDDCRMLFEMLRSSHRLCFCAPIYFYHLPALLKAFIDRSQSVYNNPSGYWAQAAEEKPVASAVLLAGRKRGRSLFTGSEITLKYFLHLFGRKLRTLGLRGVETGADLRDVGGENAYRIEEHVAGGRE
ncbi:MAG: flavodoxin family protein [Desulfonatronovibrionaceae bacterium]